MRSSTCIPYQIPQSHKDHEESHHFNQESQFKTLTNEHNNITPISRSNKPPIQKSTTQIPCVSTESNLDYSDLFHLAGNSEAISSELCLAAYNDDAVKLKAILNLCGSSAKKLVLRKEAETGRTAVWYAACRGSNSCLKILLDYVGSQVDKWDIADTSSVLGENENEDDNSLEGKEMQQNEMIEVVMIENFAEDPSFEGTSPLMIASALNHSEAVSILLLSGNTNPDVTNEYGSTAAMLAAFYGHEDILQTLILYNANINKENMLGMSSLLYAAKNGHLNVLKILTAYNVDFSHQNKDGFDCIMMAVIHDQDKVIEYLSSILNEDSTSLKALQFNQVFPPSNHTPIHTAVIENQVKSCKALLQSPHVNISSRTSDGFTIFHTAIHSKSLPILQDCLCHSSFHPISKFIINLEEATHGYSPLLYAISIGYIEAVKLISPLVDCNASGCTKRNDLTPLFLAVERNDLNVARVLLELGPSRIHVDHMNNDGHTALIVAASLGLADMCELLVKLGGADVEIRTKKGGQTAMQKAKKRKFDDVVELLKQLGAH